MSDKTLNPSRKLAVLPVTLAVALMALCWGAFAADTDYKEPDPKVIASAESFHKALAANSRPIGRLDGASRASKRRRQEL